MAFTKINLRPRLNMVFPVDMPETFENREAFEDFVLDMDIKDGFWKLKNKISREQGLDIDNESDEQTANQMAWLEIYAACKQPYTSHY